MNIDQGSEKTTIETEAGRVDADKHRGKLKDVKGKKGKKGCKSSTEPAVKTPRKDVVMSRRRRKDIRHFLTK